MSRYASLVCVFGVVTLIGAAPALAGDPGTFSIEYAIHDVATDANSPVVWKVGLDLSAAVIYGHQVGWRIEQVVLTEMIDGAPANVWAQASPVPDTPDGLWWSTHQDPNAPTLEEFTPLPYLGGTATLVQGNDTDLWYDLLGCVYQGPPPYDVTGSLAYSFASPGNPPRVKRASWQNQPVQLKPRSGGGLT